MFTNQIVSSHPAPAAKAPASCRPVSGAEPMRITRGDRDLSRRGAGPDEAAHADDWARLERFLHLGCESGTFFAGERELVADHARSVQRCIATDGLRTLRRIVDVTSSGSAPKNDPALFSLAMAAKLGDEPTRRAAYAAVPRVCAFGTHLMVFAEYAQAFGGWGRGMRKAIGAWFNAHAAHELAYQLAAYPQHARWCHRDLLRLAHPRAASPSHDRLFAWAVRGELPADAHDDPACALAVAIDQLGRLDTDARQAAEIIRDGRLPLACVPPALLRHAAVWDALLANLPISTLIAQLSTMTRVGLLQMGSTAERDVVALLSDPAGVAKARLHPIALLAALVTYKSGRGARGQGTWLPLASIVDALESAFYASFRAVEPAGKRMLLALDVSGSMASGSVAGVPGLTPRLASAALALVTAATEREHVIVAFTSTSAAGFGGKWGGGPSGITTLPISPRKRLEDAVAEVERSQMGGTDCALPMRWARENRIDVDTFCVYTDNETWSGHVHPTTALRAYRDARSIPAKLVVVGMTSHGFSIADPHDAGMLDVVGFDPSTPPVIADFARA